ncbi:MAG: xanthine dehydrogenase family protein subunit M [Myxococcota bacterium]|nr:xanthine dehydrogenase family protein subunit M [Myxococcota bacterium]
MAAISTAYDGIEVIRASDLLMALSLRAAHPEARVLAGGTDLMVEMDLGHNVPGLVLDIWGVDELRGVCEDETHFYIGALTTHTEILSSSVAQAYAPSLVESARTVGALQIQNRGTLGGNIANASPAGDTLPVLLSLDAEVELSSASRGRRRLGIEFLFTGYRELAMEPDELVTGVWIPKRHPADHTHYRKVGTRLAQAISKVVLGARLRIEEGTVTQARVALGSVAATPVRCTQVEEALEGRPVDPEASRLMSEDISPIDDIRSTAGYRTQVAANVLRAWLETLRRMD